MEIAPTLLGVSEDQCRITEIYYLDKGSGSCQITARVSRGGPGGYGIGKELTITNNQNGGWDIEDHNHITMYSGSDSSVSSMITPRSFFSLRCSINASYCSRCFPYNSF